MALAVISLVILSRSVTTGRSGNKWEPEQLKAHKRTSAAGTNSGNAAALLPPVIRPVITITKIRPLRQTQKADLMVGVKVATLCVHMGLRRSES